MFSVCPGPPAPVLRRGTSYWYISWITELGHAIW
ncbi:uncharacterized protein METZ01_LOCUS152443 [marine metagenome]|uniref:Uncharacterized protein n=1 Tax=marine metagenome TaxID=408172 RepID=A0A382ADV8_9ZZZZ